MAAENEKLRRDNQRLQEDLEKAHIIIDVQKTWPSCWVARSQEQRNRDGCDRATPSAGGREACLPGAVGAASQLVSAPPPSAFFPGPQAGPWFSPRALSEAEQQAVLTCLHEERFQDSSPAQVCAALLDEGRFHCSIRTRPTQVGFVTLAGEDWRHVTAVGEGFDIQDKHHTLIASTCSPLDCAS